MMGKTLEFKIFVLTALVLFFAVLTVARAHDKRRPQFFFILYLIYLVFQSFQYLEFYPLSAFQRYALPDDQPARYTKAEGVLDGGSILKAGPEQVLPVLAHGRIKYFIKTVFQRNTMADEFAQSFNKGYEKRIRKAGDPPLLGVQFEKRKWDIARDPKDADRGFLIKKINGEPKAGLND